MSSNTKQKFNPPWYLRNAHLQTMWATFLRHEKPLPLARHRITLDDGDYIDLDYYGEKSEKVVLLLHGLTGSSDSRYINGIQQALWNKGFQSVCMNFRGCSGQINRKLRSYNAGQTSDLEAVIKHLSKNYQQIYAVGYSIGGSVLANYLGRNPNQKHIIAAALVSVPYKLHLAAERMKSGFSKIYQQRLVEPLRYDLINKLSRISLSDSDRNYWISEACNAAPDFFEFDDKLTAPIHGFDSVDHYYNTSSSYQVLDKICTPTLIIHAKDDPFMSEEALSPLPTNNSIEFEISDYGGHVGFVTRESGKVVYWSENRICDFLSSIKKASP